jgi:glutathione peroxidase
MPSIKKTLIVSIIMLSFFSSKVSSKSEQTVYNFFFNDIQEKKYLLSQHKGKVLMVVNVASQCGFTKQYEDLQKLHEEYKDKGLVLIGIPSNDFGNQEPGSNKEIKNFCESNFGITFPIMGKTSVIGKNQHPFYKWVKDNYGKSGVPKWNFYKVLINKNGHVEEVYSSLTKPKSSKIIKKLNKVL